MEQGEDARVGKRDVMVKGSSSSPFYKARKLFSRLIINSTCEITAAAIEGKRRRCIALLLELGSCSICQTYLCLVRLNAVLAKF